MSETSQTARPPSFFTAFRLGCQIGILTGCFVNIVVAVWLLISVLINPEWQELFFEKNAIDGTVVIVCAVFGPLLLGFIMGIVTGVLSALVSRVLAGFCQSMRSRMIVAIVSGSCIGCLIKFGFLQLSSTSPLNWKLVLWIAAWGVVGAICGVAGSVRIRALEDG